MALDLVDRFGNAIPPSTPPEPDVTITSTDGTVLNLSKMTKDELRELHALILDQGKVKIAEFNEDLITEEEMNVAIETTMSYLGLIESVAMKLAENKDVAEA